jgi:hypothetical protein
MQSLIEVLPRWAQLALLIVPALSASLAAVGLLFTVYQSRRTNAQARAALVAACLTGFAEDEDIQSAFYMIEYSEFKYDAAFHRSDEERNVDKLLRHFANVALAWQAGLLSTHDVRPIQYYLRRVLDDAEIQKYLKFIAHWSERATRGEHPYAVLTRMAGALRE